MVLIYKHHSELKTYNSYHTCIKQLAKRNNIPQTYLVCINRTTVWRWKKEPDDKYLGKELTNIDLLGRFLERKESKTIIRTYLKVANAISGILSVSNQLHKLLKQNKKDFIQIILRYKCKKRIN
ncbi:MAG: hypothetical protein AMS27_14550 [Bacteroides sp. SM23_62_1]|nr:MAG: hypothetical protein AMS27_14550 [Bacteroides sp. SM23_62_1]